MNKLRKIFGLLSVLLILNGNNLSVYAADSISIKMQPSMQTVIENQTATFKVTATGNGLKYQWQVSSDGKNWTNSGIASGKTAVYTFEAGKSQNGRLQRCVITDASGNKVVSSVAAINVISTVDWELPIM